MRNIAKINENDRKALFHNTAAKMGMTDAIIEKDFWVCYMLDYLFIARRGKTISHSRAVRVCQKRTDLLRDFRKTSI